MKWRMLAYATRAADLNRRASCYDLSAHEIRATTTRAAGSGFAPAPVLHFRRVRSLRRSCREGFRTARLYYYYAGARNRSAGANLRQTCRESFGATS